MKLILSGGGSGQQSKGVDSLFASLLVNTNILYIPVAMDRNKHSHDECLAWMENGFAPYGDFQITLLDENGMENISYEEMIKYGGIFIGGGNTFKLLKILRETGFENKLKKLLTETETPVIGGSAGALIFAQSIETAEPYDPNNFGVTDFKGMNLINGMNIWVHYIESMDDLVMEYIKRLGTEIIAIPEDSGLFIDNGKVSVVGENSVKRFPVMEVIEKGESK